MRYTLLLLALLSCQTAMPDEVHAGVSYRDEDFNNGSIDTSYGGETWWLKAVYVLKPRRVITDYSPDLKLFLTGVSHDESAHKIPTLPPPTTINVESAKPKKGVVGEAGDAADKLLNSAKNADGGFSWAGVGALFAMGALVAVLVLLLRKKQ